jgi:hypothetical protein
VVARANFAAALAEGRLQTDAPPPDLDALAARAGRGDEPAGQVAFFHELLTGRRPKGTLADSLCRAATGAGPAPARLNRAVALLLARPDAQLT